MLVTIASFSFLDEALLAKAQLDAFGIPSFVADAQTANNLQWAEGARLQVPEEFVARAEEILHESAPMPESDVGPAAETP